jgi:hypothetical protein
MARLSTPAGVRDRAGLDDQDAVHDSAEQPDAFAPASSGVDDVRADCERLSGPDVSSTQLPTGMGPVTTAAFDDASGNLIQIAQRARPAPSACGPSISPSWPAPR